MKNLVMGLATCALVLASCGKNESFDNTTDGNMIGFGSISDRLTTRAAGANDAQSDFKVFANYTAKTDAWYMNAQVDGTAFTYSPIRPWPVFAAGSTLTFYAFAPHDAITVPTYAASPVSAFTYTVPTNADVDLTIAAAQDFTTAAPGAKVDFSFAHMLSSIKLGTVTLATSLADAGYSVDLTGASLKISAEFTGGTNDLFAPGEWTSLTGTHKVYAGNKVYYIMPHAIPDDATTIVMLQGVKIMDGATEYFAGDIKAEYVPQAAASDSKFKKGTRYTVNFTIGSNVTKPDPTNPEDPTKPGDKIFGDDISFSASNVAWDEETIAVGLGN